MTQGTFFLKRGVFLAIRIRVLIFVRQYVMYMLKLTMFSSSQTSWGLFYAIRGKTCFNQMPMSDVSVDELRCPPLGLDRAAPGL